MIISPKLLFIVLHVNALDLYSNDCGLAFLAQRIVEWMQLFQRNGD